MPPQSQTWPADRALLLVHGIGDAHPGDYDALVAQLRGALEAKGLRYAIYVLYYDQLDEWVAQHVQASTLLAQLVGALRQQLAGVDIPGVSGLDATSLGNVLASYLGDVLWPILLADSRRAVQSVLLQQLQQIVQDGIGPDASRNVGDLHVSILAHSLGCFHVFEALHAAASSAVQGLSPGTDGVQFDNVIFMASPVQLIRTAAGRIRALIPQPDSMRTLSLPQLAMPSERIFSGELVPSARRTVSITGNLDPVGGYLVRQREEWAYADLPGQVALVDDQAPLDVDLGDASALTALLQDAIRTGEAPTITPQNPHDWSAYVARHLRDLQGWLA